MIATGRSQTSAIVWNVTNMIGEVTHAQVEASGPTASLLYDDWYPALRASVVGGNRTTKAMLLGLPLVLGRTAAGKHFAMRDACPHRGIPLSYGWFDGQRVTCKYHGWAFEPVSGQCREIPSLTSQDALDPSRIYAAAFPCEERDGHVWVYVPQPGRGRLHAGYDGVASRPGGTKVQRAVSNGAPLGRPAVQRGPRNHWADGPGARAICA